MNLFQIQAELKVPKNQTNAFGKYKYRSAEDIIEAVKPILAKHNTSIIITDEVVQVGDRIYIKATAKIFDETSNISVCGWAREEETKKGMDAAQITGACSSYARKYALNGLFAIDDTKDADATNNHNDDITEEDKMYLISLLENTAYDENTKQRQAEKIGKYTSKVQYNGALKILKASQI